MHIFFDTATFDNIQKDKKIKFEAQLSLVGGTMGLLTGFSIISAIEIINFFLRFDFDIVVQTNLILFDQAGTLLVEKTTLIGRIVCFYLFFFNSFEAKDFSGL